MVILRFRTTAGAKDMLKKLKKMHKFTKELIECIEDKYEEDEEEDDDEDYRMEEDDEPVNRMMKRNNRSYGGRYRRGM